MSYQDEQRGYMGSDGPQNHDYWVGYNKRLEDNRAEVERSLAQNFPPSSARSNENRMDFGPAKTMTEMAVQELGYLAGYSCSMLGTYTATPRSAFQC